MVAIHINMKYISNLDIFLTPESLLREETIYKQLKISLL